MDARYGRFDLDWLERHSSEMKRERQSRLVSRKPRERNPRVVAQRGLFLCNVSKKKWKFSECLLGMLLEPPAAEKQVVSKLVLTREDRMKLCAQLRRMSIDHGSMFQGPKLSTILGGRSQRILGFLLQLRRMNSQGYWSNGGNHARPDRKPQSARSILPFRCSAPGPHRAGV